MVGILTRRYFEILTQNEEIELSYERKIRSKIHAKISKVFDDFEVLLNSKHQAEFILPIVKGIKRIYEIMDRQKNELHIV